VGPQAAVQALFFCHGNQCTGSLTIPKIKSKSLYHRNHSLLWHPGMQVKAPSCKEEALCDHDPETLDLSGPKLI